MVKLKKLRLAKQVVTGAFINGALIGGAVVAGMVIAGKARSGGSGLCKPAKAAAPQDQQVARDICDGTPSGET